MTTGAAKYWVLGFVNSYSVVWGKCLTHNTMKKATIIIAIALIVSACEEYNVREPRFCYACTTTIIVKGPGTASIWTSITDVCNTPSAIKDIEDAGSFNTPEAYTSISCKLK